MHPTPSPAPSASAPPVEGSFALSNEELQQMVAETDTGGRKPTGLAARIIIGVALVWVTVVVLMGLITKFM